MSKRTFWSRWAKPVRCDLLSESAFEDWCRAHEGAACHLVVPSHLLHELSFESGLPLHSDVERRAYARQQFSHYFGAAAQRWPLALRLDGASALHGVDWIALQARAKAHRVRFVGAQPYWAALIRHLKAVDRDWGNLPTAALAWVDGALCSWIVLEGGRVRSIRQLRLRDASASAIDEALPQFDGPVRVIQANAEMFAAVGKDSVSPVSFLPTRHRPPGLAWGLMAIGALTLATAGWKAWTAYQALALVQHREASLESRLAVPAAPVRPTTSTASLTNADRESERRAREVQALLQLPWESAFTAVERLGAHGQSNWLSMEINGTRRELRLDGVAPDKLLALQLVDHMAEQPGWQQVMLGRLQAADAGMIGQRFDLTARFGSAIATKASP
jgi:hypothetical protein